jgi:hypothetical protein
VSWFRCSESRLLALRKSRQHTGSRNVTHILQFRRDVIREFFQIKGFGLCSNCGSYTPGMRKDGSTKVHMADIDPHMTWFCFVFVLVCLFLFRGDGCEGVFADGIPWVAYVCVYVPCLGFQLFLMPYTEKAEKAMAALGRTLTNVFDISSGLDTSASSPLAREEARMTEALARRARKLEKKKAKRKRAQRKRERGEEEGEEEVVDSEDDEDEKLESSDDSDRETELPSADVAAGASGKQRTRLMFPIEVERHLQLLWKNELTVLTAIYNSTSNADVCPATALQRQQDWRMLFVRVLAVPPSRFRPPVVLGELTFDHAQNHYYKKIIELNSLILELAHQPNVPSLTGSTLIPTDGSFVGEF